MRKMYKAAIEKVKGKNTDVIKTVDVERSQEKQFLDLGYVFNESGEQSVEVESKPDADPDADSDADKE